MSDPVAEEIAAGAALIAVVGGSWLTVVRGRWGHWRAERAERRLARRARVAAIEASEDDEGFSPEVIRAAVAGILEIAQELWRTTAGSRTSTRDDAGLIGRWAESIRRGRPGACRAPESSSRLPGDVNVGRAPRIARRPDAVGVQSPAPTGGADRAGRARSSVAARSGAGGRALEADLLELAHRTARGVGGSEHGLGGTRPHRGRATLQPGAARCCTSRGAGHWRDAGRSDGYALDRWEPRRWI